MGACCGRMSTELDEPPQNRPSQPSRTTSRPLQGESRVLGTTATTTTGENAGRSAKDAASQAALRRAEENRLRQGKDGNLSGRQVLKQHALEQKRDEPLVYD